MPESLPIDAALDDLCAAVRARGCAVVVAPPGSGKSTRAAPALLDTVSGTVLLLQPRRVAAISLAERIASEQGSSCGDLVGYRVRFQRRGGAATRLWVETEGTLTRRLQADPYLDGVGAVVLDEFHERSQHADLALAWLAELRRSVRPDLAVVVMSATLAAEPVAAFLDDAPVIRVNHAPHPVTTHHLPATPRERTAEHVARGVHAALDGCDGDVLAFLPGVGEIMATSRILAGSGAEILPLHGSLSAEQQAAALRPSQRRRVVLATNVAETSLTVPGVRAVVDSGLARVARFDPGSGLDRLELERISAASADQRRGRAGRLGPGACWRLWSQIEDRRMSAELDPEVLRCDLSRLIVGIIQLHGPDLASFPWFQAPDSVRLSAASELLADLGVLGEDGNLNGLGKLVVDLPLHPRLGRLVVAAASHQALELGIRSAALLDERDIRLPPRHRNAASTDPGPADLLDRLDALEEAIGEDFHQRLRQRDIDPQAAQRVWRVVSQLRRSTRDLGASDGTTQADTILPRLILSAWPDRVAKRSAPDSDRVSICGGTAASIDPSSCLRAHPGSPRSSLLVAHAIQGFGGRSQTRQVVRMGVDIDIDLLESVVGDQLSEHDDLSYDAARDRVIASRSLRYRDLTLRWHELPNPDPDACRRALADAVAANPNRILADHPAAASWLERVAWVGEQSLADQLPVIDHAAAWDGLCANATSLSEVAKRNPLPWLQMGWQHADLARIDTLAPASWTLPGGRQAAISYEAGKPVVAARIQEWFGCTSSPMIADGRVPLTLHLLAPNNRVQQITDNLPGFWARTWLQVRKDLRGRYPKHAWPEDPTTAEPAGPRRRR